MTKQKLSYFRHITRRQGSSEKTIILGNIEGGRKRRKLNRRWLDFIKEATGVSL